MASAPRLPLRRAASCSFRNGSLPVHSVRWWPRQSPCIFVSHDREFVSSLANRILEFTPEGIIDFTGNYEDYLRSRALE